LFVVALLAYAVSAQADVFNMPSGDTSLSFVTVADPGNVADPSTGYGAVGYTYQIGKYDVTIGQYCQFLDAVATTSDPYGLYNSNMAAAMPTVAITRSGSPGGYSYAVTGSYNQGVNCPIFEVSWGDAARFCNWLQNGQPSGAEGDGTTEMGAYNLNGATSATALMAVTRNAGTKYFIPTENEWYKAAYYDSTLNGGTGGYWAYPTKSNTPPINTLPDTGNHANFTDVYGTGNGGYTDPTNHLTPVGDFVLSPSAYGTYDQGGDVAQLNETDVSNSSRGLRGGAWGSGYGTDALVSSFRNSRDPTVEGPNFGFRVAGSAAVSEPVRWASAVSGNWSNSGNWTGSVPNGVGAGAAFSAATTVAVTVTLDTPVTLGSLQFGNFGSSSVGYTLSGSGSNTLTLNNSGSAATIMVIYGSHVINAPVVLADKLQVSGGGTLAFGTASSITDNGGGYSLTMNGNGGTIILSGSNSYSGGTTVNAGTLLATNTVAMPGYNALGHVSVAGGGVLAVRAGDGSTGWSSPQIDTLWANATWSSSASALGIDTTNGNFTYGSNITAALSLTKLGPNSLTLTGANGYTGLTTVSGGTLQLGDGTSGHDASLSTSGITSNAALVYNLFGRQTANYPISGNGTLTQAGPGTLTLTGSNTYSGNTLLAGGILALNTGAPNSSVVMSSNTTLDVSGASSGTVALGSLADAAGSPTGHQVLLGGNTLDTGLDYTNTTFSGRISGGGGLSKSGTGNFTFSGASTYTGATAVNAGTLLLTGSATLATSPSITIASGATLDSTGLAGGLTRIANQSLGGGGTLNGNLTATGATITPLSGGSLSVSGNTILNSGTVLNLGIGDGTQQLLNTSGLTIGGPVTVNVALLGSVTPGGSYPILTNNAAITGAGSLSLGAVTIRGETLDTTSVPGTVQVDVGTPANLTWAPSSGNKWSVNADKNWNNTTSGTNPDVFYQMDSVTFDDSGLPSNGAGTVTLVGNLAPTGTAGYSSGTSPAAAVMVNVSAGNSYTFTGPGSIVGATSLSMNGGGTLTIANTNSFGGVDSQGSPYGIVSIHQGEIHVNPSGVLTNNTSEIDVGDIPGQTGTLTMNSGSAIVPLRSNDYSGVNVGVNGGTGIVTLTGNSLLDATPTNSIGGGVGGSVIEIGLFQGSVGTVTVGGSSTMRANNGPFGNLGVIAVGSGGTGTLVIQDQGLVETGFLFLGESELNGITGGAGTLYLNGGTLSVPFVWNDVGTTGNLYFNGGRLQATASSSDFLQSSGGGTLNAYVQAGGAVIDSNGYTIAINLALLHDASGPVLDGGLTKVGSGKLILSGSDSYTGGTTVNAGTLIVVSNTALPGGTSLTVGADGTFVFDPSAAGSPAVGFAAWSRVAAVPEPGTLALLATGALVAFAAWRLRGN